MSVYVRYVASELLKFELLTLSVFVFIGYYIRSDTKALNDGNILSRTLTSHVSSPRSKILYSTEAIGVQKKPITVERNGCLLYISRCPVFGYRYKYCINRELPFIITYSLVSPPGNYMNSCLLLLKANLMSD